MEECKDLVNGAESYQCGGISASELDKKLSHLLIEQQEGQINELEAELQTTQSKLQEKEAELQALKVCVRRLTEFPLLDRSGAIEISLWIFLIDKNWTKETFQIICLLAFLLAVIKL